MRRPGYLIAAAVLALLAAAFWYLMLSSGWIDGTDREPDGTAATTD